MSASLLFIQKLEHSSDKFPGYFVASTAPHNVEDDPLNYNNSSDKSPEAHIQDIAEYLTAHKDDAEILVVIHGYNTNEDSVKKWFDSIQEHIASHYKNHSKGLILIGYRWPSEQIISSNLPKSKLKRFPLLLNQFKKYKDSLPVFPSILFLIGLIALLATLVFWLFSFLATIFKASGIVSALIVVALSATVSIVLFVPIFTIIILRLVVYFRDNYRANHFGTPDLVELIRQIDAHVIALEAIPNKGEAELIGDELSKETEAAKDAWDEKRVKLSFLGHSMGGFVVTNAVRILSDVFDTDSIGTLDAAKFDKKPSGKIGNVFCLGRLVLVSPDIPAETIISGRANFLQSSLRRFEEAYLFSNEGDMALRLASTAANYFSYPSKTRDGGYRLGNVMVRGFSSKQIKASLIQDMKQEPEKLRAHLKFLKRKFVRLFGNAQRKDCEELSERYGIVARMPNGLLVKLQPSSEGKTQGFIYGGQLAKVENGKVLNLRGEILTYPKDEAKDEVVDLYYLLEDFIGFNPLNDVIVESLQEEQIVSLANGEIVSLQKMPNGYWHLEQFPEGHICSIQNSKLFSFDEGKLVRVEQGDVFKVSNGRLVNLSVDELQKMTKAKEQPIKLQSDQFAILQDRKFAKIKRTTDAGVKSFEYITLEEMPAQPILIDGKVSITWKFPLDYLFIREKIPLSDRQKSVALAPGEPPIGEFFTFFDCTDYVEPGTDGTPVGVLSHSKQKEFLNICDYFSLTKAYFYKRIDTHGGYFNKSPGSNRPYKSEATFPKPEATFPKPEATFSKFLIYGLACVGFEKLLDEKKLLDNLKELATARQDPKLTALYTQILNELAEQCPSSSVEQEQRRRIVLTQVLSRLCQERRIQVLLSGKCYRENVLKL